MARNKSLKHDLTTKQKTDRASFFFFSSRRRHTRSLCDWSSDVCSSDLLVLVELQNHHVELLVRLDRVGRVLHAAPAQVRQVQQAVDSAQVHERTVVGDVLHVPAYDLAFAEIGRASCRERVYITVCGE